MADWKKKWDDSGYYFSDEDRKRAEADENFRDTIFRAKEMYANGDQEGGHALAEQARSGFQYSGGLDGSEYNPWENQNDWWLSYEDTGGGSNKGTIRSTRKRSTTGRGDGAGGAGASARDASTGGAAPGRPAYTPQHQDYIDEILGKINGMGDYSSPYAERIDAALGRVENYGPYDSPYAQQIAGALSDIENYGPYNSPYADRIAGALDEVENYGPYASPYAQQISDQMAAIQNRDPFSYDLESDPAWQAYRKQYTREGRRASEDAMGQYAAMTGGLPSTAAMAAAQQAGDYYRAQMTDKIPELYKLAYSMYADEGNNMYRQLDALRGLDSDEYGRYVDTYGRKLNTLNALQGLDQTEYGRYADTYDRKRALLSDLRGLDNDEYGRYSDGFNRERAVLGDLMGLDAAEYGRYGDAYNRMIQNIDVARTLENDNYGRYRDTVGDWENDRDFEYAAGQDQKEWDYRNRAYEDSREDSDWEKDYKERAYEDSRADTQYERDVANGEIGPTIYAYGTGAPYEIGSGKGRAFIETASAGQTMTGGDGSLWRKNEDGSVTITKNGNTWTVPAPAVAGGGGGWSGGGTGGSGGGSDDKPKSAAEELVEAFKNGDHRDETIRALLDAGITQQQIEAAGYTGDYFSRYDDKYGTGLGETGGKSAGVQRIENSIAGMSMGLTPADVQAYATYAIEEALDNDEITPEEADDLLRQFGY